MPYPTSPLSSENVLRDVHDPVNQVLRTNAVLEGGTIEVTLTDADDSIKIGNGSGTYLAVNPNGSINAVISGSSTITGNVVSTEAGLNSFQTSQYAIGTTAVQLAPTPLPNRSSISVTVMADPNVAVYIGNSSSVTTSNGYPLFNGSTIQLDLTPTGQIWAITNTPTQDIAVLEIA